MRQGWSTRSSSQPCTRERLLVRGRALVLVEGELQRRKSDGGAINLVAESIHPLNNEDGQRPTRITELPTQQDPATSGEQTSLGGDDFGQVAPAVMNFAQGRRR